MKRKILLLATGGTIASLLSDHGLRPGLDAEQILAFVPEALAQCEVEAIQICNIDSTNMNPEIWKQIACAIEAKYLYYDGFVICHGTDTMAYTSAALSYMIQNSNKPIVITGSQKPISEDSTDAKRNLTDSIRYA
ncbi:MAG: asparaginase, partial [Clostridia bacterium]|nr:asparaginase [Clostridia bacterium]